MVSETGIGKLYKRREVNKRLMRARDEIRQQVAGQLDLKKKRTGTKEETKRGREMKKGWEYKKRGDVAETIYAPGQENRH